MVCLHGFTDTWRTWELVLGELERKHEVLAPTLLGHAGGPPLGGELSDDGVITDAVERAMDDAGFATAHLVGNSLGGYIALELAARGRSRSVVAFAPAGPGQAASTDSGGAGETVVRRENLRAGSSIGPLRRFLTSSA
jgi:pimeloyl-ACP methyl ester carboxylesterase